MKYTPYFFITFLVIILDQSIKLWVYYHMDMGLTGQIKLVDNWFKIHYTLNPGMAFGLQIEYAYGKLFLTLFRIIATFGIAAYLVYLIRNQASRGLLFCVSLILGGAAGNVIDSTFYGVLLGNAPHGSPTPWFHGQVIDMIYIDIWEGYLPNWMPLIGGEYYSFWPIFNIADSSIFIGIFIILFFQRSFFLSKSNKENIVVKN